jgi:hypothetical protein
MTADTAVNVNPTEKWMRALPKVSMRSVLIAGVASVGIATAVSNGPISPPAEPTHQIAASSVAPARISDQDVELMAYIPVWSDAMSAVAVATELIAPLVDTVVLATLTVANGIPVVNVVSRQVELIYVTLARPVVVSALTCGALFLGYLSPVAIGNFVSTVLASLANFVQAEVAYFVGGGWIPLSFGALAAPFAAANRSVAIDSFGALGESSSEAGESSSEFAGSEELTSVAVGTVVDDVTAAATDDTDVAPVELADAFQPAEDAVTVPDADSETTATEPLTLDESEVADDEDQTTIPVSSTDSDDNATDATGAGDESSDVRGAGNEDGVDGADDNGDKDGSVGAPTGGRPGTGADKSDSGTSDAGGEDKSSDSDDNGAGQQAA